MGEKGEGVGVWGRRVRDGYRLVAKYTLHVYDSNVNVLVDANVPFRLSVSQLPGWAQRQVQARPSIAQSFSTSALERAGRRGDRGGGREEGGGVEGCWAEVSGQIHVLRVFDHLSTHSGCLRPAVVVYSAKQPVHQ